MKNDDSIYANHLDDLNFRDYAISATLTENLQHMDIDTYLEQNKENMIPHNLPFHLELLLKQKGLTKADVVRGSQLNRKYVYQIFSGEKTPSRNKLIALAFGLQLTAKETQTMLKLAGYRELYVRDAWDTIILYALQRGKSILETNDLLYKYKDKYKYEDKVLAISED